jgi:KaiC/GvpD/RAD55 family RecA-like ATPase
MQTSSKKQKLLIEYLLSSSDVYALCKSIVKPAYFDPEYRNALTFCESYYDKHHTTPDVDQVEAESGTAFKSRIITRDQIEYCATEIESFCKYHGFRLAVLAAPKYMEQEDYGSAQQHIADAMSISLTRDLGIQYFNEPLTRLEEASIKPQRVSSRWIDFDDATNGGFGRKELVLFSANSGGGKSITLANVAVNMLHHKLNVLYITLELAEDLVAQRFDSMFTGIPSVQSRSKYKQIATELDQLSSTMGQLFIKHMPVGTTANDIRSYLKEFQLTNGFVPDVLIVDYLDIMGANEKVSSDNISEKDKQSAEQLREIIFDYNMIGATASQQNRSAIEAEQLHQGHIAGGLTKVNTVDVYVSIVLTPVMKASGEICFVFLKTRNSDGVGKTIYLTWVNNSLRIMDPTGRSSDKDTAFITGLNKLQTPKRSLLDMMDDT